MFKKKLIAMLAAVTLVSTMVVGCGNSDAAGESVVISGSTSVGPLLDIEAEVFNDKNPNISIEVNQTGSSAGIKDVISGVSEIGMSSRDIKDEELQSGITPVEIALDGVAVITNKNNGIKNLTAEQVKDIFTGKITNWKEVGGNDGEIVVVSREAGSGTRDAFEGSVGYKEEELTKDSTIVSATGAVKETVAGNDNAIGYISLGYVDDKVNALTIDNVEANAENVKNKTYKIQRPFVLVYKEDVITEEGKSFIDFILGTEGQKIIAEEKLTPIN